MSTTHFTMVAFCCILVLPARSSAQRIAPSRFAAREIDSRQHERRPDLDHASTLRVPSSGIGFAELRGSPTSRAAHAGYGALIGAMLGGTAGFIVDRRDHSGEGLVAPVMILGGAAVGAAAGAVVGVVLPLRSDARR